MPAYTYRCDGCNKHHEVVRPMTNIQPPRECLCGVTTFHRVYDNAASHFRPDPNHERDRNKRERILANPDGVLLTKKDFEDMEHTTARTRERDRENDRKKIRKAVEESYIDVVRERPKSVKAFERMKREDRLPRPETAAEARQRRARERVATHG